MHHWISDSYWWVRHRVWQRFDVVRIRSLEPGYYDIDTRLFHVAFDLLVEFVELELVYDILSNPDSKHKVPWYQSRARYVKDHIEELIDEHVTWCKTDPSVGHKQRDSAIEIATIYNWYKHEFPIRARSWNVKDFEARLRLEEQYEQEDDDMLVRLIKIRKHLWT
jgi:hypothetical protein